jgi:hypothetical protein
MLLKHILLPHHISCINISYIYIKETTLASIALINKEKKVNKHGSDLAVKND